MGSSVFRFSLSLTKLLNTYSLRMNRLSFYASKMSLDCNYSSFCHCRSKKLPLQSFSDFKGSSKSFSISRSLYIEEKLSPDAIAEKVLHVCKTFDKIPADKLTLDSHFMNDLGLDSLDHVELIMNIEDDFNFEIPDGDAEKLLRPKDIVEYITQKELST